MRLPVTTRTTSNWSPLRVSSTVPRQPSPTAGAPMTANRAGRSLHLPGSPLTQKCSNCGGGGVGTGGDDVAETCGDDGGSACVCSLQPATMDTHARHDAVRSRSDWPGKKGV